MTKTITSRQRSAIARSIRTLEQQLENSAVQIVDALASALAAKVPIVAVFGQQAGWTLDHPDPVVRQALAHVHREGSTWRELLSRAPLEPNFYAWLSERFARRAPSPALELIGNLPLSCVFTSSVDPGFANLFCTNGREPETVLLGDPGPPVLRSRRRPPIYYLFGRASAGLVEMQPPLSMQALTQRRVRHANAMLRNIVDSATALGLILVDGYEPATDWLPADELLSALSDAGQGRVIWCGPEPILVNEASDLYLELVKSGVVWRDSRSLPQILLSLPSQTIEPAERWDEPEIVSLAGGKKVFTTPRLRLGTEASVTIIDDSWDGFLAPLIPAIEQERFHSFHGVPSGLRALYEGVRREYAILRGFEPLLLARVERALDQHHLHNEAIVLHGQSGVGKTVALVRLAASIREKQRAAVLYADNRLPNATDISNFLEEVDKAEGKTLLVIDAMVEPRRYDALLDALRSRGHRVVVVGSTYRVESHNASSRPRIEALALLAQAEQVALRSLVARFVPHAGTRVAKHVDQPHALARFYWDLPASRAKLSEGLGREARSVESFLNVRGSTKRRLVEIGVLGRALIEAGYETPDKEYFDETLVGDGSGAVRVIDYVMAASRLYKAVPVNLLLRAIRNERQSGTDSLDWDVITHLFEGQDLFRWKFADEKGEELLIASRLQIEAELVCNRRLGGPSGEASRLIELIRHAHRAGSEENEETKFLTGIVFALGPDGPFDDRYRETYADVARALTALREHNGVMNARLMLQESTLRRNAVRNPSIAPLEKVKLLDEASKAVALAFNAIESEGDRRLYASRRTREFLWVERAAIYGFLATDSARRGEGPGDTWSSYLAAREAVRRATSRVDTYYPLDIGLWLPAEILEEAKELDEFQIAELQADIKSTLDLVEPSSLDSTQYERFQKQRMRLSQLLEDSALEDSAFAALDEMGSAAGYYLRARDLMPDRPEDDEKATARDIARAREAVEYLSLHRQKIVADSRCLYLLLSAEWIAATGRWLFRGQRQPLPFAETDRSRIRSILQDLIAASGNQVAPKYRYLEAVLNWLTNDEESSRLQWKTLAHETEYIESGRVLNRHVITDAKYEPLFFEGTVARQIGDARWSVYVPAINRHVDLIERDYLDVEVALGRTIRNFAISFNYLGPRADPYARLRAR